MRYALRASITEPFEEIQMKQSSIRLLGRGVLAGAVLCLGLSMAGAGVAPERKVFETEARWLDDRLPEAERKLLEETVGYAFPGFEPYAEEIVWLANKPDDSALKGSVVVLQSFTTADAQRRGVLRRTENLARRSEGEAIFIAVHTPENAEEAERFAARSSIPVVLDRTGRFSDDMGFWKSPAAVVIDRAGTIRVAGANALQANRFLASINEEEPKGQAPKLISRVDRDKKKPAAKPSSGTASFPEAPAVQNANDLRNKPGPALQVQKYMGREPNVEGKVVMVVFWATWCGPCIAGIPHQNALHNAFPDDLVIIGLTNEDEGVVNTFRSNRNNPRAEYVTAIDPQRRMINIVGNRGIPHCIVMSSDGIVRWQGHPGSLTQLTMEAIVNANKSLGAAAGDGSMRWIPDSKGD